MNKFLTLKGSLTTSSIAVVFVKDSGLFPPGVQLSERKNKHRKQKRGDVVTYPKLDGYGGHWNPKKGDTTIYDTARRKLHKKAGVTAEEKDLILVGVVDVFYPGNISAKPDRRIHYFFLYRYDGKLRETEKMGLPKRFTSRDAPYEHMRPIDQVVLPLILEEKYVKGDVRLANGDGTKITIATKNLTCAPVIRVSEKTDPLPRDLI